MKPDIVVLAFGASATLWKIGEFAQAQGLRAAVVWDKDLVDELGGRMVLVHHQQFCFGAAEVVNCSRSANGPVIAAMVSEATRTYTPPPEVLFRETHDTILNQFRTPGIEIYLTGHQASDTNLLRAVVAGAQKYTAKGN